MLAQSAKHPVTKTSKGYIFTVYFMDFHVPGTATFILTVIKDVCLASIAFPNLLCLIDILEQTRQLFQRMILERFRMLHAFTTTTTTNPTIVVIITIIVIVDVVGISISLIKLYIYVWHCVE